jgi:hypothetical protein
MWILFLGCAFHTISCITLVVTASCNYILETTEYMLGSEMSKLISVGTDKFYVGIAYRWEIS